MGVALEEEKLGFIFPRGPCVGFGDRDFNRPADRKQFSYYICKSRTTGIRIIIPNFQKRILIPFQLQSLANNSTKTTRQT